MKQAGQIMNQFVFTDKELDLAIESTALCLAYLEGRGVKYTLVTTPIRQDLDMLHGFKESRKIDAVKNKQKIKLDNF